MEEILEEIRRTATARLSTRNEPPTGTVQYRKIIEHIDKILNGREVTSDDIPRLRRARGYAAWPT